jgi:hypothetical protein
MQVADRIIGDIIKWLGVVTVDVAFSFLLTGLEEGLVLQYTNIATPGMYIASWLSPLVSDTLWIMFAVDFFLWFLVVGAICIAVMRYTKKGKLASAGADDRSERDPVDP